MARTGLARALSKMGHCSRSQGVSLIKAGRVTINGTVARDPEKPVEVGRDLLRVDGVPLTAAKSVYVMLNKPRGLVTTASDEQGRDTVFECFKDETFPHISPVGRLDKASEGLLLFTNDNAWADQITNPVTHLPKTYHVQVGGLIDETMLSRLKRGVVHEGEKLTLLSVSKLREGEKNTWLEIVLDEGRNRHIRRVLEVHNIETLRLIRVAVGDLVLGKLAKGSWRHLTTREVTQMTAARHITPQQAKNS